LWSESRTAVKSRRDEIDGVGGLAREGAQGVDAATAQSDHDPAEAMGSPRAKVTGDGVART
jgi:hypothetical protein